MTVPSKKKPKYTYGMIKEAYEDVKKKNLKIRQAARHHSVPESTLRWRLTHPQGVDVKRGGPTIFTQTQEEQLAQYCVQMAHIGYGFSRWQVLDMAKGMCEVTGKTVEPTKHWFYGFLHRFPDVHMVKPKKREIARDVAVTDNMLQSYFTELRETLDKYNLLNKPEQIWNIDETGILLDHNPPKIVARTGTSPYSVTAGKSPTTTVIAAGSALGETIPPYIIYKGQRVTEEMRSHGLDGSEYRTSPTGWSNSVLFADFFQNHFLHHIKTRPCILFYDGHSTHINVEIIETARRENIHLFVLPPHSSHCLQPLDVSVFSSFKKSLSTEFHKYWHSHPNSVVTRQELPRMIAASYRSAMTVDNIMAGFRKTGIFPFNPSAPIATAPQIKKKPEQKAKSRKERKDNRTVKILFQKKTEKFEEMKEQAKVAKKKKRKTFVPPYGAPITEDRYLEEKKRLELEAKQREATKSQTVARKTFVPPFVNKPDSQSSCINNRKGNEKSSNTTEKSLGVIKEKTGKGPKPNSKKGKGPKPKKNDEDDELCVVCGKWQPDGLRLDQSIKFVNWGQCVACNKWVHLKFCTEVVILSKDDVFVCPKCCSEP